MKYRKKPIEIEASFIRLPSYLSQIMIERNQMILHGDGSIEWESKGVKIRVKPPFWLLPEADGQGDYPCSPEIFEKLYEKVEH